MTGLAGTLVDVDVAGKALEPRGAVTLEPTVKVYEDKAISILWSTIIRCGAENNYVQITIYPSHHIKMAQHH